MTSKEFKKIGEDKPYIRLTYNLLFQEIWDFHLTFVDWKALSVGSKYDEEIDPQVSYKYK